MPSSRRNVYIGLGASAWLTLATACTTSNQQAPSQIETTPDGGFTVTQELRVGVGVRGDFDSAVRLLEQEQVGPGIEGLLEVTEAAPQMVAAHIDLGIAYRRSEDLERAEASITRALELSPRHPVAHNELGMIQRRQGRFEDARASYERALDVAPSFHFARLNLAILCDLFLADLSCALEHYERYAQTVPQDEMVGMWIGDLRRRAGMPAEGR